MLAGAARAAAPIAPGQPGLVLTPGPIGWWDSERVSCPRVIREADGGWKMWCYGRDPTFDRAIGLPTGRIGLATSPDGVHWTQVRGPGVMGSVMDPAEDQTRFDAAFVAVSDVRRTPAGYDMAYFGGAATSTMARGHVSKGFPIRAGRAVSTDGLHWVRQDGPFHGAVLDVGPAGAFDANMIGWPQILQGADGVWRLYYHAVSPELGFAVGLAVSDDGGATWRKVGPVLTRGDGDAFDNGGPGTRQVFLSGGRYVMLYEGFGAGNAVAIGLAISNDGEHWTKVKGPLKGGAVFAPSAAGPTSAQSPWDSRAVGTPWVVALPDGGHRLYYVGNKRPPEGVAASELTVTHQIGLAVAEGDDFTRWRRWGA
jgi:hypothetical protein